MVVVVVVVVKIDVVLVVGKMIKGVGGFCVPYSVGGAGSIFMMVVVGNVA